MGVGVSGCGWVWVGVGGVCGCVCVRGERDVVASEQLKLREDECACWSQRQERERVCVKHRLTISEEGVCQ